MCPWHHSAYDVRTGRMVRGPQRIYAKVPGLNFGYRMLTDSHFATIQAHAQHHDHAIAEQASRTVMTAR